MVLGEETGDDTSIVANIYIILNAGVFEFYIFISLYKQYSLDNPLSFFNNSGKLKKKNSVVLWIENMIDNNNLIGYNQ